jgi:hypothetical protein
MVDEEGNQNQNQHPVNLMVKPSAFWLTSPGAWFAIVEGKFLLRGIASELAWFYNFL